MKLASIERIIKISPIEGADKIELAQVLGFQTVIKKGEFKEEDYCVWHNPDTVVNETNPVYNFLAKNNFRLKTVRFKGKYSQGLALPLSAFGAALTDAAILEGTDVSEIIGIKKYIKPIPACLAGLTEGNFPSHVVSKTDEPLLLSHPTAAIDFVGQTLRATLKMDGSSGTFFLLDGVFGVCSRNLRLKESPGNSFWKIARSLDLENKFRNLGYDIVIQGEVVGPGIQNNPIGLNEIQFFAFNGLIPNSDKLYMNHEDYRNLCTRLGIAVVPEVWSGIISDIIPVEEILNTFQQIANIQVYSNGKPAEGIVIRPNIEQNCHKLGSRLSAKVINEKYSE